MDKDKLVPAKERIKIATSQTAYFREPLKEKIWKLIDNTDDSRENLSTTIERAINLLYEKEIGEEDE